MTKIQFDGLHYETGSVHNILALQGIQMPHTRSAPSEALLLGLSGGITFGYFSFAYKGLDPHVALPTKNTFAPLEKLFDRLGVVRTVKQTTDSSKAERNLINAQAAQRVFIRSIVMWIIPMRSRSFKNGKTRERHRLF
jgi:hypothetical protein